MEDKKKKTAKTDIVAGIGLILFALYCLWEGMSMPVKQLTGDPSRFYGAPGFFPVVLSVLIIIGSVIMIYQGFRDSGGIQKEDLQAAADYLKSAQFFRLMLAVGLLAVYVFGMLGRLDYYAATFIFLAVTMILFQPKQETGKKLLLGIIKCLVISGIMAFAVGCCFENFAQIPLP